MRTTKKSLFVVMSLTLLITGAARADWYETDNAKWVQLPDLAYPTSLDVYDTHSAMLADDFLCTSIEPIASIHIWGSWQGDNLPGLWEEGPLAPEFFPDPSLVNFRLSIHADIPEDPHTEFSIPGEKLWEEFFDPGEFTVRLSDEALQGWYNPNTGDYIAQDHGGVWQYNFYPQEPFEQLGTVDESIVYWLSVDAKVQGDDLDAEFGWKTSLDHWNDDAVWIDAPDHNPSWDDWQELFHPDPPATYPDGLSLDMAFVIVPEPVTMAVLALGLLAVLLRNHRRA